jgi:hypothetical protein
VSSPSTGKHRLRPVSISSMHAASRRLPQRERGRVMHPSPQCRLFATGLGMPARCGQIVQACRRQVNARALLD